MEEMQRLLCDRGIPVKYTNSDQVSDAVWGRNIGYNKNNELSKKITKNTEII